MDSVSSAGGPGIKQMAFRELNMLSMGSDSEDIQEEQANLD